jgi:tRNA(fMet)-specific endonuclease VapC
MYLLDTNACIRILNNSSAAVVARFGRESPATIRLCSVVKAELLYGARKSRRVAATLKSLDRFFDPIVSLPFDDAAADEYGVIRAQLERAGTPIGANDLMIAAIARHHDLTLVTNNLDEFCRIAALRIDDWETSDG